MKSWRLGRVLAGLIVCGLCLLQPLNACAEEKAEIEWLLAKAGGDTLMAALMYTEILEHDNEILTLRVEKYERLYETEKDPWYVVLWDSDITKGLLFVAGVYMGREMVLVK